MDKCPKCKNSLSSSDVLCPKCGAMVEQISTAKIPINKKMPEKTESSPASEVDYNDSLIMYNESFPIIEQEPSRLPEENSALDEEPEDFDIEKIISASDKNHVNPLLAHIKKQSCAKNSESQEAALKESDFAVEDICEEPETDYEPQHLSDEVIIETQKGDEAYFAATAEPDATTEEFDLDTTSQQTDDFPFAAPKYSKDYLEAIMNMDISDEELEPDEEEFDPDAFMEKFRQDKESKQTETEEAAEQEQPIRRRFDPNRPKPKLEEEEIEQLLTEQNVKQVEDKKTINETAEPAEEEYFLDGEEEASSAALSDTFADRSKYVSSGEPEQNENAIAGSLYNPLVDDVTGSSRKRLPIWAAFLIWLAVAGCIFFGAFMLDGHVRKTYQSYSNYLYEITGGKIDISGAAE